MSLELTIVTPEGQAFHGEVESVVLPGAEGDFGVLAGHEPFLSALRTGGLELEAAGKKRLAAVSRGYAEIHGDKVSVMVGTCEWADEIDTERAERARQRAEERLKAPPAEVNMDFERARIAMMKSLIRLQVASRARTRA